jgi:hypothetical protein
MPSTANTWRLIAGRVGEKGQTAGEDVRTVQQLLVAAGDPDPHIIGGGWGDHSKKALLAFQQAHHLPEQNFVDPDDECLFALAEAAQILVPMPNLLGMSGVTSLHQWFVDNNIQYQKGAETGGGNRALYGLDWAGCIDYAIQRIDRGWRAGPVKMDCTTYVNCMLGVFLHGNLHSSPYAASCAAYGDTSSTHMARERYHMPLVMRPETKNGVQTKQNYFKEAEDIAAATISSGLYVLEVGGGSAGGVTHMALLYDQQTYECTTGQSGSACITRKLEEFVGGKKGKIFYLCGPLVG